jgi:hypothetical protein
LNGVYLLGQRHDYDNQDDQRDYDHANCLGWGATGPS